MDTVLLQPIHAAAKRWHECAESLGNGQNGNRRLIREWQEADDELDALWLRRSQRMAANEAGKRLEVHVTQRDSMLHVYPIC
jgi:hypothetical protein